MAGEVLVLNAGYEVLHRVSIKHAITGTAAAPRRCAGPECIKPLKSGQLCDGHQQQRRKHGSLTPLQSRSWQPDTCRFDGCGGRPKARWYCSAHYRQNREGKTLRPVDRHIIYGQCTFDGCGRPVHGRGLCGSHHAQYLNGRPLSLLRPDKGVTRPVGSMRRDGGYVRQKVSGHRFVGDGWPLQHVIVMSEVLGRPLRPGENVHHLNGQRDDNRPENLELWTRSQPAGQRVSDKVAWAVEFVRQYAPELLMAEDGKP